MSYEGLPSFEELVELSGHSIVIRLMESVFATCTRSEDVSPELMRKYRAVSHEVYLSMRELGVRCRLHGGDLRKSPFWPLMEHHDAYERLYEYRRHVQLDVLTPLAIYSAMDVRNILHWRGWRVEAGPVLDIWLYDPDGQRHQVDGTSKFSAHRAYRVMSGHAYSGPDTLGEDAPHPAEMTDDYCTEPEFVAIPHQDNRFLEGLGPLTPPAAEVLKRLSTLPPANGVMMFVRAGRSGEDVFGLFHPETHTPHSGGWKLTLKRDDDDGRRWWVRENGSYDVSTKSVGRVFVGPADDAARFCLDLFKDALTHFGTHLRMTRPVSAHK